MKHIILCFTVIPLFGTPAHAQIQNDDIREACTHDAFRLCNDSIPDESRTKACLAQHSKNLGPLCKSVFRTDTVHRTHHEEKYRTHHEERHYWHHKHYYK